MIIYAITNWVNGKKYIGQTRRTVEERWREHLHSAKQPSRIKMSPYLYAAMNLHGLDNFTIAEVDRAETQEELDDLEELWIAKCGTTDQNRGYNISWGGASTVGPETRAKLSASLKGKPAWNKGKPMGEEHYKNTVAAAEKRRGVALPITPQGRESLRQAKLGENNPNYGGKAITEDTIRKMREAHKGKPAWNKGIPQTEEARQKMRGPRPSLTGPRPHLSGLDSSQFRQEVSTESIKQLRSIGFNYSKLAEHFKCSPQTIKNRIGNWPEREAA